MKAGWFSSVLRCRYFAADFEERWDHLVTREAARCWSSSMMTTSRLSSTMQTSESTTYDVPPLPRCGRGRSTRPAWFLTLPASSSTACRPLKRRSRRSRRSWTWRRCSGKNIGLLKVQIAFNFYNKPRLLCTQLNDKYAIGSTTKTAKVEFRYCVNLGIEPRAM